MGGGHRKIAGKMGWWIAAAVLAACLVWGCADTHRLRDPFGAGRPVSIDRSAGYRLNWLGSFRRPEDLGIRPGAGEKILSVFRGRRFRVLGTPAAVCTFGNTMIAVVDRYWNGVHFYDLRRGVYRFMPEDGAIRLESPVDAAFDSTGILYVTDSAQNAIFRFDPATGDAGRLMVRPEPERPTGICWDEISRTLHVTETAGHRIMRITTDGRRLGRFGKRGTEPGAFNFPVHLAMGPAGELAVCDAMNFRVQRFRNGIFTAAVGRAGDGPGEFAKPKGIAMDSRGRLFVVDAMLDVLQVFTPAGRCLLRSGGPGSGPGRFSSPADVWVAADGRIYVADAYNRRIQVFMLEECHD